MRDGGAAHSLLLSLSFDMAYHSAPLERIGYSAASAHGSKIGNSARPDFHPSM